MVENLDGWSLEKIKISSIAILQLCSQYDARIDQDLVIMRLDLLINKLWGNFTVVMHSM